MDALGQGGLLHWRHKKVMIVMRMHDQKANVCTEFVEGIDQHELECLARCSYMTNSETEVVPSGSMVFSRLSIKAAVLAIDTWRFPLANNLHRVRGTNQRTAVFLSTNLSGNGNGIWAVGIYRASCKKSKWAMDTRFLLFFSCV